jgi:hypothetical protein
VKLDEPSDLTSKIEIFVLTAVPAVAAIASSGAIAAAYSSDLAAAAAAAAVSSAASAILLMVAAGRVWSRRGAWCGCVKVSVPLGP